MIAGVCALLLAAGQGSRFRAQAGADKLLVPHLLNAPGDPVILLALRALAGVGERSLVVARADNRALIELLRGQACDVLQVRSAGLGDSLAQAVEHCGDCHGWLVALGDMPYVGRGTVRRIAAAIEPGKLVVPTYQGRRGHPRGIGSDYRKQLLALRGDQGAQALFERAAGISANLVELAVDDPGILVDVDLPGDRLARFATAG
ncbi:nucleotidyltransferase family protein [Pseudomonas borbori]